MTHVRYQPTSAASSCDIAVEISEARSEFDAAQTGAAREKARNRLAHAVYVDIARIMESKFGPGDSLRDDLTGVTFENVFSKLLEGKVTVGIEAHYVRRAASNQIADHFRNAKRDKRRLAGPMALEGLPANDNACPEQRYLDGESAVELDHNAAEVRDALGTLNTNDRALVEHVYFRGGSIDQLVLERMARLGGHAANDNGNPKGPSDDAAKAYKRARNAVDKQLQRARKKLLRALLERNGAA